MNTLVGKIDVKKIDKDRLYKGEKGTYLDIVLIPTPDNKFGDTHMIVQSVSEEERKAGKRGAILGNAKLIGGKVAPLTEGSAEDTADDDLPF